MMGRNKEDEANERRAREKLLARRDSARSAASSATQTLQQTNGKSSKSREKLAGSTTQNRDKEKPTHSSSNPNDIKKQDNRDVDGLDQKRPERQRGARTREREGDKRMSNRGGGEASGPQKPGGPRDRERGPPPSRGRNDRYSPPPPHYRDTFGRGPPPHRRDYPPPSGGPGYYNDYRGPPPMRHSGRGGGPPPPHYREGGMPSGRWERDRGMNDLPPRERALRRGGRSRSPPPHLSSRDGRHRSHNLQRDDRHYDNRIHRYEDDRHRPENNRHQSRRGRSQGSESSRSYGSRSRSRSRSYSSHGSSSSVSSSENGSRSSGGSSAHSKDSRSRSPSRSRSRSYSRSRSPSPKSPTGNKNQEERKKIDASVDQQKRKEDDENKDKDKPSKTEESELKKGGDDGAGSPSSAKGADKSNEEVVKRSQSRSRSTSRDSHGRSRRGRRERKRKDTRNNDRSSDSRSSRSLSRSHSPTSAGSRSHSPASSSYSTSSSHNFRGRRRERKSKRRRRRHHRGTSSRGDKQPEDLISKDQRTIFVSQLVMRTTERDLKKYFKKKVGCKVNDVILLRDRRNARNHKGCAYVEVGRIEDVATAVAVSGQPPDFQRFPILIKASEAEKNYICTVAPSATNTINNGSANSMNRAEVLSGPMSSAIAVTPTNNSYANNTSFDQQKRSSFLPPLKDENGRLIESQKIYVGGLDPSVSEEHLFALFSQFGSLQKVQLQYHPNTQISRGYAFLAFRDPKVSHLAIRTMAGKYIAGRQLKTGWANQNQQSPASVASGCTVVTSDQFPENAAELSQKALSVMAQMSGGTTGVAEQQLAAPFMGASNPVSIESNGASLATMAEQELDKAMGLVGTVATSTSVQAIPTLAEARTSMGAGGTGTRQVMGSTVAEARASLAADMAARQLAAATSAAAVAAAVKARAAATAKSSFISNADSGPMLHLLVHNMYDKDEETEDGWETEIKDDFLDECSKFGKIVHAKVMHKEAGGKIYATFADLEGAKNCAENLAGRWFDKRQLRVDYMTEANPP